MKPSIPFSWRRSVFIICLLLTLKHQMSAQNTSYNLNSTPISGSQNTAFGHQSMFATSSGSLNSALGYQSLYSNTSGTMNSAFGYQSLLSNTTGRYNVAFGTQALQSNTTGYGNVGIGNQALSMNTGEYNTAIGMSAMQGSTTGSYNTAIGRNVLFTNATGAFNVAIGDLSLFSNGTGAQNTAIGSNSLFGNTSGTGNTAIGFGANVAAGNLTNATAIGFNATVTGSNMIQLGNFNVTQVYAGTGTNAKLIAGGLQITGGSIAAGKVLTSDAFGNATWQTPGGGGGSGWSLTGNAGTIGNVNFLGTTDFAPLYFRVNNQMAGLIQEDPIYGSTYFGLGSGKSTSIFAPAPWSCGFGIETLQFVDEGSHNTAVGAHALQYTTNGATNTAVGIDALRANTTAHDNCAFGGRALDRNTTGGRNTAIGRSALHNNFTGNDNTAIGFGSDVIPGPAIDWSTAIGLNAVVNISNKMRFGSAFLAVIEGQVPYSIPSDGRFKLNVSESDVKGLEFINRLRPVVYNFDTQKFEEFLTRGMEESIRAKHFEGFDFAATTSVRQSGFIAQEVEEAAKLSGYNFNGLHVPQSEYDNYSIAYSQFVVPLVKSVQELSKQNEELKQAMVEQQRVNESLKKEMDELRSMINGKVHSNVPGKVQLQNESSAANLFQNAPNPFDKSTIIRYSLPATAKKAYIIISSISGARLKEYELTNKNGGVITISAGQLPAGSYVYSLIVENILIDSKIMVLTR